MGGTESKPEGTLSMTQLAVSQEIEQDYGIKLPHDIIVKYMDGDIKVIRQFVKCYKNMTERGYEFGSIYQEGDAEISVWNKNEKTEKRGWRIK